MYTASRATNPVAISAAPATAITRKRYYDLPGTIELMKQLRREGIVDGFEFQNLAEWDKTGPPRDEAEHRLAAWNDSQKHTIGEITARLQETGVPILSVHANRDVGVCLCSDDAQDVERGRQLIHESLSLAEKVRAPVCVFHLWDTWKAFFDPGFLQDTLCEIAGRYPCVKAAVENVPTHLAGYTPLALVKQFEWVTLDLKWAALYDELDEFGAIKDRIANVHLRGRLEGNEWVLPNAPFRLYEALDKIRYEWGYSGLLTMEPDGLRQGYPGSFAAAMASLR